MKKNTGLLIPAAGNSSRMNSPKPFLTFNKQSNFIEQIVDSYSKFGISYITVVIDPKHNEWENIISKYTDVKFIENHHVEYGRFYSILLGIKSLPELDNCFLQNIDNPFVSHEVLNKLIGNIHSGSYSVPTFESRGGHPILLCNKILNSIKDIEDYSLNLREVLSKFNRINVEVNDSKILMNINTEAEYEKLLKL